jgi:lysozyme family protein
MANFEKAHAIVMSHEGGYANDPDDKGGETYKGIARRKHPFWPGWALIDLYRMHSRFPTTLDDDEALQLLVLSFFKTQFWDVLKLDKVNHQNIAAELYDTAVNMGTGIAAVFLQTALNVSNKNGRDFADLKEDGRIGPVTLSAINKHARPGEVLKVLNVLQGSRYIAIMQANPTQEKFFRSWFSRVNI